MGYSEGLTKCRDLNLFKYWLEDYQDGIGLYSNENCEMVSNVFDSLIDSLVSLGEEADECLKVELFEGAVKRLNVIRNREPSLIETMERDEFCDLFDAIAVASKIDPKAYGAGEGIASEWREW